MSKMFQTNLSHRILKILNTPDMSWIWPTSITYYISMIKGIQQKKFLTNANATLLRHTKRVSMLKKITNLILYKINNN